MSAGTIFTELDLDFSKFEKNQQKLLQSAQAASTSVEKNWQNLGVKSDNIFNAMRASAENSFNMIKNHAGTSAAEITRAQEAMNAKITAANAEQFGKQTSALETLKANWVAASAAIVAAWMLVNRAIGMMDEAGHALQVESSFKIMADAAGVNAERMIASMKAATKETIDDSDLMQKAVKLMTLGYDPAQIERFSKVVITASQIAGTSAAEAYDALGDAIANRLPKALVRMGAATREQMVIVNEAIKSGADSVSLYELAMANLELKQKMLQGTMDTATIALQRFHAEVNETGESVGKILIGTLQVAYGSFQGFASAAIMGAAGLEKLIEGAARLAGWTADKLGFAEKAAGLKAFADSARTDAEALARSSEDLALKAQANITRTAEAAVKASKVEIDAAKSVVAAQMEKLKGTELTKTEKETIEEQWKASQEALKDYDRAQKAMYDYQREADAKRQAALDAANASAQALVTTGYKVADAAITTGVAITSSITAALEDAIREAATLADTLRAESSRTTTTSGTKAGGGGVVVAGVSEAYVSADVAFAKARIKEIEDRWNISIPASQAELYIKRQVQGQVGQTEQEAGWARIGLLKQQATTSTLDIGYGIGSTPSEFGAFNAQGGGIVPGPIGSPQRGTAHGGEVIFTPEQMEALTRTGGRGGNLIVTVQLDGRQITSALEIPLAKAIAAGRIRVQ